MTGVNTSHLSAPTLQALRRLDTNNNGVTTQELKTLDTNNDGQINASEGQAGGIDASDVTAVNAALQAHASEPNRVIFSPARMNANDSSLRMLNVFNRVDSDNNGYLSTGELNTALHSSSYTGADATAVAAMARHSGDIEEFSDDEYGDENDGITRQDIRAMVTQPDAETGQISALAGSWGDSRISRTNHTLFPNGVNSVRSDNIEQGTIGDCSFLAAVGAMARTPAGRQQLHDMIQDNNNGTYTVTFPGRDPVTVNAPTDAEIALYATAGQDGTWLSTLEKAFAESTNNNAWISSENPYSEITSGRSMASNIELLTGHSTDTDDLSLTSFATLRSKLTSTLGAGRSATASIRNNMPFTTGNRSNGLPMGHAYTVVNYNAATDQITLRNPWGRGEPLNAAGQVADGNDDGTFTMSLTDFNTYFNQITYEQAR
jgi:Ca2+-binding EF-hand superfamily protein